MKIAIIGAKRDDSMEYHFADAFLHAGHGVRIFDIYDCFPYKMQILKPYFQAIDKTRRIYSDKYDRQRFHTIADKVNSYNPDLIVCFYKDIHPTFVDKVRGNNKKVIHINPDQMTTLGYQQIIASKYDAWFTKDKYMLEFMKMKAGLNVYLYNEAFNHRYNPKPICDKAKFEREANIDVMTYGTLYPYRTRMLKHLINAGIDIKLYGVIPHRFFDKEVAKQCTGKYIVGKEKANAIYGAKIVFNNFHFAEIESVNCRFFEVNGCGGFQLCDYRPLLNELLPIDPKLISFKDIKEGIDKVKYYLSHDNERIEISEIIYKHFISRYTYDHLIKYIIDIVTTL